MCTRRSAHSRPVWASPPHHPQKSLPSRSADPRISTTLRATASTPQTPPGHWSRPLRRSTKTTRVTGATSASANITSITPEHLPPLDERGGVTATGKMLSDRSRTCGALYLRPQWTELLSRYNFCRGSILWTLPLLGFVVPFKSSILQSTWTDGGTGLPFLRALEVSSLHTAAQRRAVFTHIVAPSVGADEILEHNWRKRKSTGAASNLHVAKSSSQSSPAC